jgi:hypothetical protein
MEGSEYSASIPTSKTKDGDLVIKTPDGTNIVINDDAPIPSKKAKITAEDLYIAELKKSAGLTAPVRKPSEFGFKDGDTYVLVNASTQVAKAFDFHGNQLFAIECMATGQAPQWRNNSGDTPPGLYKIGEIYNDYARVGDNPAYDRTLMSYGWITFDMVDLEGNEDKNNRAGICWHGGGSGCGWPGAWAKAQKLLPTLGCLRSHNIHLLEKILPRAKAGTVFIAVYQDQK